MEITNNSIPEFDFDIVIDEKDNQENTNPAANTVDTNLEPVDNEFDTINQNVVGEQAQEETIETATDYGEKGEPAAIAFYDELKERGIFSDGEFDGSWDSLKAELDAIPQKAINKIVEDAPELTKQVLRFAFADENITKDGLLNFMKTYLDDIAEPEVVSLETMDDARAFLEAQYKAEGKRSSVIISMLNALEDDDALLDEAKIEQARIVSATKSTKSEQLITEAENTRIAREQVQTQFISKLSQELETTGWKEQRVSKVKAVLANNNINSILNEAANTPKALVQLADFISYWDNKTKEFNYTAFIAQSQTNEVKSLKDRVEQAIQTSPTLSTKAVLTKQTKGNLDDMPMFD